MGDLAGTLSEDTLPPPITDKRLVEILTAVEQAGSSDKAASYLGLAPSTIRDHVRKAHRRGLAVSKNADPIEIRRLKDRLTSETAARHQAERRALQDHIIRESIFGLTDPPLNPPVWNPSPQSKSAKIGEAAILMLSDFHFGEVIELEHMGGVNSFNQKIARARAERLFKSVVDLLTEHWTGPPASVLYVLVMGDMISGEIHEELSKTNDLLSIPAVRNVSECLIAGLDCILAHVPDTPIKVISIPGNHGRTTRKPENKSFALDSYDTLVAWSVQSWFKAKGEKRINFYAPPAGETLLKIFGWTIHVSHGDRIGSRGGGGFIGPAATVARGFQKVQMDYASQGISLDIILIGHFHTAMELPLGFVNGCLSGPSEYSKSGRMRPEPASQWLLSIHKRHGVAKRWKINAGSPSEGSIYRGREQ